MGSGPTGNTATLLNDIGISNTSAINTVSDVIGTIADASGAIGAIASVVVGLINLGQPDQIQTALQNIQNTIQNIDHQLNIDLAAAQILSRNSTLLGDISGAWGRLQTLTADINAEPPLTPGDVSDRIADCCTALNNLSGKVSPDLVWNRNYDWEKYWTDAGLYQSACFINLDQPTSSDVGYGEQAPSPNVDGATVFDYRYSLPLYLFAVSILLAVGRSLDPKFTTNYTDPLKNDFASVLQNKHDQIVNSGLKQLTPPNWAQAGLQQLACPDISEGKISAAGIRLIYSPSVKYLVVGALIEYGAVERFSGYSSIGDSYQINFKNDSDDSNPAIFNKLQLRLLKRTKDVYAGVGLPTVWQVVNTLNVLAGSPPPASPTFLTATGIRLNLVGWSFRQILGLSQLAPAANGYSLRALASFIIETQPLDSPYLAPLQPNLTISFRQLLTSFSD